MERNLLKMCEVPIINLDVIFVCGPNSYRPQMQVNYEISRYYLCMLFPTLYPVEPGPNYGP